MAKQNLPQRALARFGGEVDIQLAEDEVVNIGQVIMTTGFSMTPWALDDYERAPYLLRKMLRHPWRYGQLVYVSLKAIARRCEISEKTLGKSMKRLERLGYVRLVSSCDPHNPMDRRRRYDVSGIFTALALCIMADRRSKWARDNGGPIPLAVASAQAFHRWPNTDPELRTPLGLNFEILYGRHEAEEDDEEQDSAAYFWDMAELLVRGEQAAD
jgi:hypothetical protein